MELHKEIQKQILDSYRNRNLSIDDVVSIMKMAREQYHFEMAFITTNKEYKYLLNNVAVYGHDDIAITYTADAMLTSEEYNKIVETYAKSPVCDEPMEPLKDTFSGSVIHTGIICQGEYYGTLGFWSSKERIWSEDERQILLDLGGLALIATGVERLTQGWNRYELIKSKLASPKTLSCFYLNMETGKCHAMKPVHFLNDQKAEWRIYSEMIENYIDTFVDPVYGEQFMEHFSMASIAYHLKAEKPVLTLEYPQIYEGKVCWIRCTAKRIDQEMYGPVRRVMVLFENITKKVQERAYLTSKTNQEQEAYVVIATVDLETERYGVNVDNRAQITDKSEYKVYGKYRYLVNGLMENHVEEKYAKQFEEFFSMKNLRNHFAKSSHTIQYDFPYQLDEDIYWVRLEVVKSRKFSQKNQKILFYFSDITEEKLRLQHLEETKVALEKENARKKYQMEHDPLTGVYNRQGYDTILEEQKELDKPVAYIQVDVDNFKTINDTYGHKFGDSVLKQVATQLLDAFRADDYVFRFGGDEFAVLLTNCREDVWESISYKQRMIHIRMNQQLKKKTYVTLSMGVSWSESGFHDSMIGLADEALYMTKKNGRAGCSVIDADQKLIYQWKDDMGNNTHSNPLAQSDTGAYRLEFAGDNLFQGRLICNETTRALMGLSEAMTPEECYMVWMARIDEAYKDTIKRTRAEMIDKGQAECVYAYHHPRLGKIMVRSGGKATRSEQGIVFFGYHQSIQETQIILQKDDTEKLVDAINGLYFASYYIDLTEDKYYSYKGTSESRKLEQQEERASVGLQNFVQALVKPPYREKMSRFVNSSTLQERLKNRVVIEMEYESMIADKGWCRVDFLPVKRDEQGNVTHVQMMITSIDEIKKAEEKRENAITKAMKLQLRVGEIIAKTTIVQTGIIDKETGITKVWLNALFNGDNIECSFEEMKLWGMQNAYKEDLARFEKEFSLENIIDHIEKDGTHSMTFRSVDQSGEVCTLTHHYETLASDEGKMLMVIENVTDLVAKDQ